MENFDIFRLNGIENYPAAGEFFLENVILKVSQTHFSKDCYPKKGHKFFKGGQCPPSGDCEVPCSPPFCYSFPLFPLPFLYPSSLFLPSNSRLFQILSLPAHPQFISPPSSLLYQQPPSFPPLSSSSPLLQLPSLLSLPALLRFSSPGIQLPYPSGRHNMPLFSPPYSSAFLPSPHSIAHLPLSTCSLPSRYPPFTSRPL